MTIIKICGIKTLEDAISACEAGADMLGFNFYSKSVRYIDVETCTTINTHIKQAYPHIQSAGVFVNAPLEHIFDVLKICKIDLVQLHGDEPLEFCAAFEGKAFKAFRGISHQTPYYAYAKIRNVIAPAFLVDASVQGVYGGSGVTADWGAAALLAGKYPFLLAGGLTPENVADAVRQVRPWGVDVASGVEVSPGVKDTDRMNAFVQAVRQADENL